MTSSTVSSRNDRSRSNASAAATISASATAGVLLRRRPPISTPPTLTLAQAYCALESDAPGRRSSAVEQRTFNPMCAGSIPAGGTRSGDAKGPLRWVFLLFGRRGIRRSVVRALHGDGGGAVGGRDRHDRAAGPDRQTD